MFVVGDVGDWSELSSWRFALMMGVDGGCCVFVWHRLVVFEYVVEFGSLGVGWSFGVFGLSFDRYRSPIGERLKVRVVFLIFRLSFRSWVLSLLTVGGDILGSIGVCSSVSC